MLKLIAMTTLVLVLGAPLGRADGVDRNRADDRGQGVSDCNHRANLQQLKGPERKDFVDWCTSRDEAAGIDQKRDRYSECYARMTDRNMSDADRSQYRRNCAGHTANDMARS